MKSIEIIVPCYNEEACILPLYQKVCEVFERLPKYSFIISYIDDGSNDNTLEEIKNVRESATKGIVQYISFSRNFGKEAAIYAGLSESTGDYVVLMDADLQHPPELLYEMINAVEEQGYDRATARRVSRKGEPLCRSFLSQLFYRIISWLTGMTFVGGSTDYCLMKRSVVEAILRLSERERFTKGIYSWVGYKNKWIEYENVERVAGKTKWSLGGLIRYAYSGFIAFATTPLRGVVWMGMIIVLIAIFYAIHTFVIAWNTPQNRSGYATLLIVMLLLGGTIITILGMIGEYLARIYMEVKNRPIFLAREIVKEKDNASKVVSEQIIHGDMNKIIQEDKES